MFWTVNILSCIVYDKQVVKSINYFKGYFGVVEMCVLYSYTTLVFRRVFSDIKMSKDSIILA